MPVENALQLSRGVLGSLGIKLFLYHEDRIPESGSLVIASNHRSILDAPVLMAALNRPIRFACHHYMGQVPLMRDVVTGMGAFPLEDARRRQQSFLRQGSDLLAQREPVGVFPEGTQPMVSQTEARSLRPFHRGFAHLALQFASRHPRQDVAILPMAIVALEEQIYQPIPIRLLRMFDPSEPLFDQPGWHPMVVYKRLAVSVGHPYWIRQGDRQAYQGSQGKAAVKRVTQTCHDEILDLLQSTR
ncbi:1-acyl-sn-glycerol-3-phosphate acyltransferase [Phormidium yuhuli AB48]|uniref:1-acyl-sn-glycerol-3-phosphate acyltransferase n=1 Tax=Phormidium yuhuli AB48 TaxID=2940671 RepID=A0ABY5ATN9_9CYAN|nr:lysophospholipid acyltransferase family protein [Phormidium yuhuli]USR92582.1 1-acyl-sn-glycerol-3-phosphate acyltransferase [Phormidium yuhuli AB48]